MCGTRLLVAAGELQSSDKEAEPFWKHAHVCTCTHACKQAGLGEERRPERGKVKEKKGQ